MGIVDGEFPLESWVRSLIDIMKRSLDSNGLPIPMDKSYCTEWARDLNIPRVVTR